MNTSCTWYDDVRCDRPRSCADCLATILADGSRCAISPIGACVSMAAYDSDQDFRVRPVSAGVLYNYYPGTNTSYCPTSDSQCASCRQRLITEVAGYYGFGYIPEIVPYCLGKNDCVCVAGCETKRWAVNVLTREQCAVPNETGEKTATPTATSQVPLSSFRAAMILMMIALGGLAILLFLVGRWWRSQNASDRIRQRRSRFKDLSLQLDGWTKLRQELIDAEHAQFDGDSKPPSLTLEPGPARVDEQDVATEAGLVVEQGEGYRPLSPSEYQRGRHGEN